MTKIKKTYEEIFTFGNVGGAYLKKFEGKENKLSGAIKSAFKDVKKIVEEYNEELNDLDREHALEDEKTKAILLHPDGTRQKSKDGDKKFADAVKVLRKKQVEINQRISDGSNSFIDSLTDLQKEAFSGIVITEQTEEVE